MTKPANKYSIRENKLIIGESVLFFDHKIDFCLEISGMLIVLLEKPVEVIYNENVFGVTLSERKIIWRIAKLEYDFGDNCCFIDMVVFEGRLRLNNWCHIYLIVNPLTGDIIERSSPQKY
jgi:hypothetical protein